MTYDTTTTPLDDHYDVAIVGARAAGAATALRLARAGLKVVAIDKAGYGADTLSTHALARAGVLLLSRWGVLDDIRAAGTPRASSIQFHYGDREVTIDLEPRGDVDGLYSPRRTVLDRTLVDAAIEAGATVRHRTTVAGIVRDAHGRVSGVEVDDGGLRRRISARFVVGADGARSRIAEQVGAVEHRRERVSSGIIYAYFTGVSDPHMIGNEFRPDHAAGVIPTNGGETCVWIGVPSANFREHVAEGVEAAFERSVAASPSLQGRLAGATRTSRLRSWPGQPGFVRQGRGAGWALVGDSGYFKDPVSAHGITDALIGAELLSDALIESLSGGDEDRAMADYERDRCGLAASMVPAVARLASFEWDADTVEHAFKAMNAAMRKEWELLVTRDSMAAAA